jgi:hypothetical protein
MTDWIDFEEGQYAVSRAYLASTGNNAVGLRDPVLEIYTGRFGKRQMKGYGLVENIALVELHEDGDVLDLLLDLGGDFRFLMENPMLQAGKVFSPGVRSLVHFYPKKPWRPLSVEDFESIRRNFSLIG